MATLTSRLIVALTDRVSGPARGIGGALDSLHRRASRTSGVLLGGGGLAGGAALRNMVALGAGYVGVTRGIGGTVGAAFKFEDAFSDVKKVLNGTPAQLAEVRHEILEMSKRLPNSAEGISDIFAAAAQSNIPLKEIGKFSEMVAKVAVAWDVTEGETSDALAKIKNQLNMSVSQIGLYSDAINHLSNNTAAAAPDLVDFSKRVAAQGDMFGFTSTETLAFGATMVAMGAQTEVASTSFRNMGMALADASNAPKRARTAFKALGIDATKVAKSFKADAVGTMLDVFERIKKLPEHERLSAAIGVFGREARALMPLINDSRELRRQLGLVANETNYAGSAIQEFEEKASTTGNALRLLGNRIRAVGIGVGDGWLPTIKAVAEGVGDVLLTLGQRVGVLDTIQTSFSSFLTGLGGKEGAGGIRQLMNDIGDALFGEAFEAAKPGEADARAIALAKTSNTFRGIGRDLAAFSADIRAGDIGASLGHLGDAISKMSGGMTVGGAIAIGLTGRALAGLAAGAVALTFSKAGRIAIMAMAVATLIDAVKDADSIGAFVDNLGKLSAVDWLFVAGGIGLVGGKIWSVARGLRAIKGAGGVGAATGAAAGGAASGAAKGGGLLPLLGKVGGILSGPLLAAWTAHAYGPQAAQRTRTPQPGEPSTLLGIDPHETREQRLERLNRTDGGGGILDWLRSADQWLVGKFGMEANVGNGPTDVSVAGPVETQPSGTQDVRVMNPMPAPVISVTVHATTNANPAEIGSAAAAAVSRELRTLSNGAYSDGAN